jgi:hypothetical protein
MTAGMPASPWTAGRLGARGRPRPLFGRMIFQRALFSHDDPVLAAAFHLADVRYSWTAGRDETVTAPRA